MKPLRPLWHHAALLIGVCVLVYGLWLGTPGFASSEGHRVVPGWTMAQSGDWLRLEMFGTPYLRKPPGTPWAIGFAGRLLGYNEWSARLPSFLAAMLGVLACWAFSLRWFGRTGFGAGKLGEDRFSRAAALAAALAQALAPALWPWGRSAEIEMSCIFGTQLASLGLIHALVFIPLARRSDPIAPLPFDRIAAVTAISLGAFIAVITKGAAGAPVMLAALAVGLYHAGLRAALRRPLWLVALAVGAGAAALLWWRVWVHSDGPTAVKEDGSFLWEHPLRVLTLLPSAWAAALPASLAFIPAILVGMPARDPGDSPDDQPVLRRRLATSLAAAWLLAVLAYTITGVGNPRYALPAIGLLFPFAGYWIARAWRRFSERTQESQADGTRRLERQLALGHPAAWPAVFLIAAVTVAYLYTHRNEAHVTRHLGESIPLYVRDFASMNPPVVTIIADGVIEARPETLLYAQQADPTLRVRWIKPATLEAAAAAGESPTYLFLRNDETPDDERKLLLPSVHTFGRYVALFYRVMPDRRSR